MLRYKHLAAFESMNAAKGQTMKSPASTVIAKLYRITGTTDKGINKSLLIVSRTPIDAIKTAENDFFIDHVTEVSELERVWTPRSL